MADEAMVSIDAWLDEKPYKELYDNVIHEKIARETTHAITQSHIGALLMRWAKSHGKIGFDWRFYIAEGTTLVPDVAFVSRERLDALSETERQTPPFAPDVAVEVRSCSDSERLIRRKTELYLKHGATIVLDVDPYGRVVRLYDRKGETTFRPGDTLAYSAFPDLRLVVSDVFAQLN